MNIQVRINLEVTNEKLFRAAAEKRAIEDGLKRDEAAEYRDESVRSLNDCAIMLFDPGMSPDGCSIINSEAD